MSDNNNNNVIASNVYLSRDEVRNQIIEFMQEYLELEQVDLTKSSFLSFMVNIISTLTSNLMFYQASIYKEFFLTKAQLPDSILNLAAFIGYTPKSASYAEADLLLSIPLTFEDPLVEINIPENFNFYTADNINFLTTYKTKITITNNSIITAQITENQGTRDIPIYLDAASNTFSFTLPVKQYNFKTQEFQIPEDTPLYQFIYIDVPFENQVAEMTVKVILPDSPDDVYDIYKEFDSLYLMSSDDKGYVARKSDYGYRLYFGNGIIGTQPPPGSKIIVDSYLTQGDKGNVITASINKGQQIYIINNAGQQEVVNYDVINPSPAVNGQDEETMEQTRSNSIKSLTMLNRLVSHNDYNNLNVIAKGSPLEKNSMPVLKRSDVKTNEIQIFSTFNFVNKIVPARNTPLIIDPSMTLVPRNTEVVIDGVSYITLFDMEVDKINQATYYKYILHSIDLMPVLSKGFNEDYSIYMNKISIERNGTEANFNISYSSFESDLEKLNCEMEIASTSRRYAMTADSTNTMFTLTIDPYTDLPENEQRYYFTIRHSDLGLIIQYYIDLTFTKRLDDMMMSNTFCEPTQTIIYDVPVIDKEYYNTIDQRVFELQILQSMLNTLEFKNYKMLTDFANLKFTNTTGSMRNMLLNKTTRLSVKDYNMSEIPINVTEGDRYIISGDELYEWTGRKDQIATCTDATNVSWVYTVPVMDDIVFIESEGTNFIYTEVGWIPAIFSIPLKLELEVLKSANYSGAIEQLIDKIKDALYDKFKDRFGANIEIYRSEIIREVQSIDGVDHCKLIKPESNIFFNFDVNKFTEEQLLVYTPEYVFFTKDDINVKVLI